MFVNIDAATRHVEMVEAFGLPNASDPHYEEIFGWYHVIDDTCYWSYHPAMRVWDVKVCPAGYDPRASEVAASPFWTEAERLELQEKVNALAFLPTPAVPKKRGKAPSLAPFLYEGWLFRWKFDQASKRWEIAPLGRR